MAFNFVVILDYTSPLLPAFRLFSGRAGLWNIPHYMYGRMDSMIHHRPVSNTSRDRGLIHSLTWWPIHFQKVLVDGHFFLSLSQRLSLWGYHLVLAVLSRIIRNLSLIFVSCGKFKYLKRVRIPLLSALHSESLSVLHVADCSLWNLSRRPLLSSGKVRSKKPADSFS